MFARRFSINKSATVFIDEGNMRVFILITFLVSLSIIPTRADSYATFGKKRFYSSDGGYFVEITENKLARMYKTRLSKRLIWTQTIEELPSQVFVSESGYRVILFGKAYGNNHKKEAHAITFLDEKGQRLKSYRIEAFSDLTNLPATTSSTYWYELVSMGGAGFVIQTVKLKMTNLNACIENTPIDKRWKCTETEPAEQFQFDIRTGEIIKRYRIVAQGS